MPISQEGENAKIPKRDFVPGGHYAKITKRERVQEGVIAKVFEGVIVLVGDYSRGCTCQALQEGENARGAKMLGGRVSVSRSFNHIDFLEFVLLIFLLLAYQMSQLSYKSQVFQVSQQFLAGQHHFVFPELMG